MANNLDSKTLITLHMESKYLKKKENENYFKLICM